MQTADQQFLTLVQITDSHLFATEDGSLSGMNCQQSFAAVLEHIRQQQPVLDGILCTGDLVQDGSAEAYRRFFRDVSTLRAPQLWLAGNHDEYASMHLAI